MSLVILFHLLWQRGRNFGKATIVVYSSRREPIGFKVFDIWQHEMLTLVVWLFQFHILFIFAFYQLVDFSCLKRTEMNGFKKMNRKTIEKAFRSIEVEVYFEQRQMHQKQMNFQKLDFKIIFYKQFNDIWFEIQMKKILNYSHCTQAEYEVRCLQNLEQDFMVHQSLRQNTSINNRESYVNILNQISFNNKRKKQHINHLRYQSKNYASQSQQSTRTNSFQSKNFVRWKEFIDFEKKIIKQEEVKIHLQAQLNDISKSINLMKGDVTSMIEKNQSTLMLQTKTSKVKLIAQDQLKKVNAALHKDHSQIFQRNNMQIKFNKKLKNICNNENNSLKRIQSGFLRGEKRKKFINDKINKMEEVMKNLNQREKIRQKIKVTNERNKTNLQQIYNLLDFIQNLEVKETNSQSNQSQKDYNLLDSHLSLKTQRFKQKLKNTQSQIVRFIGQLIHSMDKTQNQFRFYSQRVKECQDKLQQFDYQQKTHQQITNGVLKNITDQQKREYDNKLMQLKKLLSSLLIIWQFIENNQKFTKLIDEYENNDLKASRREFFPKFYRKSEDFQKNNSVINQDNNYANKFYKLILYLSDEQQTNPQSQFMIKSLEMTIITWIKGLKNLIVQSKKLGRLQFLKKAKSLEDFKFKSTIQLMEEMGEPQPQKYRLSDEQQEQDILKTMLQLIAPKKGTMLSIEKMRTRQHLHNLGKAQRNQEQKSQRIKALEKVEKEYYKMVKNVLKIQKQITKSNYNFNRKFNYSKFTQSNIIQEQKRYQSNFALQYIKQQEESMALLSKRSNVSKLSRNDQRSRKKRDFQHKSQPFNTPKSQDDEDSYFRMINKVQESIFNAKKLQRQSRLIKRKSKDSYNKQSRASVFFSRRNKINFAEKSLHQQY